MKNISAQQPRLNSDAFKGWLIGIVCGVVITISLALGTGRISFDQAHRSQSAPVAQQAAPIFGEGLVPPPIDEFQQYHQRQLALLNSIDLVPPPIDEFQQYHRMQQALRNSAGLVPPPIDEIHELHHVESPDETGAAAPLPAIGSTKY
jgi:hypothetical protein